VRVCERERERERERMSERQRMVIRAKRRVARNPTAELGQWCIAAST